jgi:exonuclease SbcC
VQLRRLEVRNIRSFEEGSLDLTEGTTLLTGDVGAGKSSLLYAIEMALFGVAEVDASYLVRHGRGDAEVSVTLADESHRYTIARSFRRVRRGGRETFVPDEITFSTDGELASYSATELRQRVIELVGFPDNPSPKAHSDLWRWAVYVPQERMREILAAKPEDRMETVRKALGVERFRIAAENAAELATEIRRDARQLRDEAGRLVYWDEEWAKAVAERQNLEAEVGRHRAELDRLTHTAEVARRTLTEIEARRAALGADERELATLTAEDEAGRRLLREIADREEALRIQIERESNEASAAERGATVRARLAADLAGAESAVAECERKLREAEAALRELAARRASIEAAARSRAELARRHERALKGRDEALASLQTVTAEGPTHEPPAPTPVSLTELDRELVDARGREQAAVERLTRLKAEHSTVESLVREGVCPTCHQPVRSEEFAVHRREVDQERAAAETALAREVGERERLEATRKSRERFERAHERWVELERRRSDLRVALSTWEQEATTASAELERITALQAPAEEVEQTWKDRNAELRTLGQEHDRARARRAQVAGELESAARAEERHRHLTEALARARSELDRLDADRRRREEENASRARRIGELTRALGGLSALLRDLETAQEELRRQEQRLAESRDAVARTSAHQEALATRIALAEKGRADRLARVDEAAALDAKAAWVAEPLRYHLLAMEKDILAHAQASFDRAFSRFFAALVDDPGLVATTDSAFTPQVAIRGEETPAEALSGGERTSLALAFRLALSATVRALGEVRLESLLLDEPTDGFSSEQVVRMGELLEELALPQVVVVSHEAQLAGIADRTVRIVKRDGRSMILDNGEDELPRPTLATGPPPAPSAPGP